MKQEAISIEARLNDFRNGQRPTLTLYAPFEDDERRLVIRIAFSTNPEFPNAMAFYRPDGSVVADTSDTGSLPRNVNIAAEMDKAWGDDPHCGFMVAVGELTATIIQLMMGVVITGGDQDELDKAIAKLFTHKTTLEA